MFVIDFMRLRIYELDWIFFFQTIGFEVKQRCYKSKKLLCTKYNICHVLVSNKLKTFTYMW
jgi:hypothetical protein